MRNEPTQIKPEDVNFQKPDFKGVGSQMETQHFETRATNLLASHENMEKMMKFLKIEGLEDLLKQLHDPDMQVVMNTLTTLKNQTTTIFGESDSSKWMAGFITAVDDSHRIQPLKELSVRDELMAQQIMGSQSPVAWNEEQIKSFYEKVSNIFPEPPKPTNP